MNLGSPLPEQIFFFLLPFFNYQTGDHLQEELGKFGYRPDVKEEIFNNSFIVSLPAGTCCTDLVGDF